MNNRAFLVAVLSAFIQYYDYHLFGFLAAKISKFYFPTTDIVAQLLHTYLIMAIGMLGKPIGAFYLGRIGDLRGRSYSFNLSLIGTALASLAISLIPSYEYIGIAAAFFLLIARMCVCTLVSSGTDGIRIYIYEHIGPKRRCLGIGITSIFLQGGALAASLSAWFFTQDFLPTYSWRASFMLGSLLAMLLIYYKKRLKIEDLSIVHRQQNFEQFKNLSTIKIIKTNWQLFLRSIVIAGVIGSTTQFYIIFFGTYNFEILKYISPSEMQFYIFLAIAIYMIFSLAAGFIADRVDPYKICYLASLTLLLISIGHVYMASHQQFSKTLYLLTTIFLPMLTIPVAAIFKESIPIVIRFRIFSLAHAIGSILISAPTSYISTLLFYKTQLSWLPIFYFITTIVLIISALYFSQKAGAT